jgi:peroxiredoxin
MGHWCPHCQKQLGDLNAREKDFAELGATVAAISTDTAEDATALRERLGLGFELYSDPDLSVITKWGVADYTANIAKPATFIVEPGGTISYRHIGQNQTDRPTTDEVIKALQKEP